MELLLFLATGVLLPPFVYLYLRFASAQGRRDEAFEEWCRQGTLVAAFHVPGLGAEKALQRLRTRFPRRLEMTNHEGLFPFPHYALRFEARAVGDRVVGLFIVGARVLKGHERAPWVLEILADGAAAMASDLDELWLHGRMHAGDEPSDDAQSFRARPAPRLELRAYRELPFWLRPSDGPGTGRRRDERRAAALAPVTA